MKLCGGGGSGGAEKLRHGGGTMESSRGGNGLGRGILSISGGLGSESVAGHHFIGRKRAEMVNSILGSPKRASIQNVIQFSPIQGNQTYGHRRHPTRTAIWVMNIVR